VNYNHRSPKEGSMKYISDSVNDIQWGTAAAWGSAVVALFALAATVVIARAQKRFSDAEHDLAARTAATEERLAVSHAGAQTAMAWRDQVLLLHDRGLDPEEIRWIMCCEDHGIGHEDYNGIIDEVIGNVPRVPPPGLIDAPNRDPRRRLRRPRGAMRAELGQPYGFQTEHPSETEHP
jgi:hypothetical protein